MKRFIAVLHLNKRVLSAFAAVCLLTLTDRVMAHEPCVTIQPENICPHKIIRSINTSQPKLKNKALCLCLADFYELAGKSSDSPLSEQQEQKLTLTIERFGLTRETFFKLLNGN